MYFNNDTINSLEESMSRMLKLMAECHYSGEWSAAEYFQIGVLQAGRDPPERDGELAVW